MTGDPWSSYLATPVVTAQAAPLELAAANRALHDALLAKATSRQLTRMITVLSAQSMRYHVLALARSDTKSLVLSHDEGLRLALDERDLGQVAEILSTHLSALRGERGADPGAGPACRHRGDPVHVGHDRLAEGRRGQPRQPAVRRGGSRPGPAHATRRPLARRAAAVP